MISNKTPTVYALAYTVTVATAVMLGSLHGLLAMLSAAGLFVWFKAKDETYRKLLVLGVPYIAVGVGSLMWLYNVSGFTGIVWFLFVVWSVDTGGMLVGTTVKGPKLAPKISPNKTWSGLLGGMLLAAVMGGLLQYLYSRYMQDFTSLTYLKYAMIAAILAIVEQIGDLVESAIKRHLGVKDSGNLIPGHGGIFDRIDGMIFAAPVLILMLVYLPQFFM
jgi:phosphatidate cytidylyltransferase